MNIYMIYINIFVYMILLVHVLDVSQRMCQKVININNL